MAGGGAEGPGAYLSFDQLEKHVPWTRAGIEHLIRRGHLRQGIHWFQPAGPHSRKLFKWSAIVAFVEGGGAEGVAEVAPDPQDVEDEVRRRLTAI